MRINRKAIAAVSITAGIAGALVLSAMPAQAHPGHNGARDGGGHGFCARNATQIGGAQFWVSQTRLNRLFNGLCCLAKAHPFPTCTQPG